MRQKNTYDKIVIGKRLRQVRNAQGLTQAQVADTLAVSLSYYSKLEVGVGQMSPQLLFTYCSKFGVDQDWLLHGGKEAWQPQESPRQIEAAAGNSSAETLARLEQIAAITLTPENQELAAQMAGRIKISLARAMALIIRTVLEQEAAHPRVSLSRQSATDRRQDNG